VFILKELKVACFHTLLQVFILKVLTLCCDRDVVYENPSIQMPETGGIASQDFFVVPPESKTNPLLLPSTDVLG
jgi:hypothetical protein